MSPTGDVWPSLIGALMRGHDPSLEQIEAAITTILSGDATDAQVAGFAVALRAKGETAAELATIVRTMRRFAERVPVDNVDDDDRPLIDTCGTGGDRAGTFNVSTVSAIIAAAAGARVAKHGNRAASSQCGSADVLEALGVVIDLGPAGVARCIDEVGIGFCFAPRFHPAMRFAAPARRELGVPTTFNFLGPLANPAGVRRQAIGVSDPAMAEHMIGALAELGAQRALVFYGDDGLDELTLTTTSSVLELRDGSIGAYSVDPTTLGFGFVAPDELVGGDAAYNADIVRRVLGGEAGAPRAVCVLNAAAALVAAGLAQRLLDGVELAGIAIDSGRAASVLDEFVRVSTLARDEEGR